MYRAEQLSHNGGSTGRAKSSNSYIKVNASAGLRGDNCTRLFDACSDPRHDVRDQVGVHPVDGSAFSSCPKGGESSLAFPRYL